MAVIHKDEAVAEVSAVGDSMSATVNFSGTLMEMLATVYSYILMAAIRETVQNGCDAARRAGLSFADGVMVQLPTKSNPVITVVDKGLGMTKAFMEAPDGYLSFGSSTKAGDNGAAGGLGVGRWAAYGYIRECCIQTCHASDMVERTYFQFQGEAGTPTVQLASEVPGSVVGTKVFFPVKESDLDEAYRAVRWLKDVMQVTMGDSFSVDHPHMLTDVACIPEHSGTVLELGAYDESLEGVRVHLMQGTELQYGRIGLNPGSLVVLTNKDSGVGGLPFHVQPPSKTDSVFFSGTVVEIPMRFNIPFMPSREGLKYTDEVYTLMQKIDEAAEVAAVARAKELFFEPGLGPKATLSRMLGNTETWHVFARAVRLISNRQHLRDKLRAATGGHQWNGSLRIPASDAIYAKARVKYFAIRNPVLKDTTAQDGILSVVFQSGGALEPVTFKSNKPFKFVLNDVKTAGIARFRAWAQHQPKDAMFIVVHGETEAAGRAVVAELNAPFGGEIQVELVSNMPEVPKEIVGRAVLRLRSGATIAYHCLREGKQMSDATIVFSKRKPREVKRVYVIKKSGNLDGFTCQLADLLSQYGKEGIDALLGLKALDRLYLLTPKQLSFLQSEIEEAEVAGVWELDESEVADEDGRETLERVKALKTWQSLEEFLIEHAASPEVQTVLDGKAVYDVTECWRLSNFIASLSLAPRLMLSGTKFDKAISPYFDVVTGISKLLQRSSMRDDLRTLCTSLVLTGEKLDVSGADAPESRKELAETLARLKITGHVSYTEVARQLRAEFPLLTSLANFRLAAEVKASEHFCYALAYLYK